VSFRKYYYAASPLDILTAAKRAGVTIAQPVAQFDEYSRRKIVEDLDKVVLSPARCQLFRGEHHRRLGGMLLGCGARNAGSSRAARPMRNMPSIPR
jgi:hypothetical protein